MSTRPQRLASLEPRAKFWVERDGLIVMSDWRIRFLEAVGETGSISAAAERLEIPYRRLWAKLKEIEENLGVRLIEAQSGGAGGGGSSLTPAARDLVRRYRSFREGIEADIHERFVSAFGDLQPPG